MAVECACCNPPSTLVKPVRLDYLTAFFRKATDGTGWARQARMSNQGDVFLNDGSIAIEGATGICLAADGSIWVCGTQDKKPNDVFDIARLVPRYTIARFDSDGLRLSEINLPVMARQAFGGPHGVPRLYPSPDGVLVYGGNHLGNPLATQSLPRLSGSLYIDKLKGYPDWMDYNENWVSSMVNLDGTIRWKGIGSLSANGEDLAYTSALQAFLCVGMNTAIAGDGSQRIQVSNGTGNQSGAWYTGRAKIAGISDDTLNRVGGSLNGPVSASIDGIHRVGTYTVGTTLMDCNLCFGVASQRFMSVEPLVYYPTPFSSPWFPGGSYTWRAVDLFEGDNRVPLRPVRNNKAATVEEMSNALNALGIGGTLRRAQWSDIAGEFPPYDMVLDRDEEFRGIVDGVSSLNWGGIAYYPDDPIYPHEIKIQATAIIDYKWAGNIGQPALPSAFCGNGSDAGFIVTNFKDHAVDAPADRRAYRIKSDGSLIAAVEWESPKYRLGSVRHCVAAGGNLIGVASSDTGFFLAVKRTQWLFQFSGNQTARFKVTFNGETSRWIDVTIPSLFPQQTLLNELNRMHVIGASNSFGGVSGVSNPTPPVPNAQATIIQADGALMWTPQGVMTVAAFESDDPAASLVITTTQAGDNGFEAICWDGASGAELWRRNPTDWLVNHFDASVSGDYVQQIVSVGGGVGIAGKMAAFNGSPELEESLRW